MNLRAIAKACMLATICAALIAGTVYAKDFSDVPKDFWGYDAIKEISDKNIIVGYTDGTFKPSREVKKVEVLIILSRILGVNEEENDAYVKQAEETNKTVLSKYNTYATREISYLLSKQIINDSELDTYLGNGNDEKSMLRYEIVPMLTRVLGKESELKNKSLVVLDYKDAEFIPQNLRAYVEYLGDEGIMGTATDDNRFLPNGSITRAQVAVLMSRVMSKMDNYQEIDEETEDQNDNETESSVDEEATTDNQETQDRNTENQANDEQNVISGPIQTVAVDLAGSKRSITVQATIGGVQNNITIPVSQTVEVTIDGKKSRVTLIKPFDYAIVELNENKEAVKITTEKKEKSVAGLVSSVDTEKGIVSVDSNSQIISFKAASDVKVIKNGTDSDITKIRKGDTVTLTVEYNLIKVINSKSIQKQVEGQISEIVISANPKVTIKDALGKVTTYDISKNASINVFDIKEDIYSLRLEYKAKLSLDSNEVIDINSYEQITGIIETVVENFNEITLIPTEKVSGESLQLLTNQNTKYIDNKTKSELTFSQIKKGQKVIVCGKFGKASFYVKEMLVVE